MVIRESWEWSEVVCYGHQRLDWTRLRTSLRVGSEDVETYTKTEVQTHQSYLGADYRGA